MVVDCHSICGDPLSDAHAKRSQFSLSPIDSHRVTGVQLLLGLDPGGSCLFHRLPDCRLKSKQIPADPAPGEYLVHGKNGVNHDLAGAVECPFAAAVDFADLDSGLPALRFRPEQVGREGGNAGRECGFGLRGDEETAVRVCSNLVDKLELQGLQSVKWSRVSVEQVPVHDLGLVVGENESNSGSQFCSGKCGSTISSSRKPAPKCRIATLASSPKFSTIFK